MKNASATRLIHELASSPWMIHPEQAHHYLPKYVRLLRGEPETASAAEPTMLEPFAVSANAEGDAGGKTSISAAFENSIAVIPIVGPLVKYDSCEDIGMMTIAEWITEAANNPRISAIILKADSPGGTVFGTQTLADAVRRAKAQKPVITYNEDGMLASAMYWVGCAATEIIASHPTNVIGSIGVFTSLLDIKPALEMLGYKYEEVYAPQSSEKNEDFRQWQATGKTELVQQRLARLADEFISVVKTSREGKLNLSAGDPFKGRAYMADEALAIGLIDSIGDFDFAVSRAFELSNQHQQSTNNSNNASMKKIFLKSTWVGIAAALGFGSDAAANTNKELGEAEWEKVNATLTANSTEIATLTEQLNAAKAETDQRSTTIATLTQERDAAITERNNLQATVDAYGTKPGATTTTPSKTSADKIEEDNKEVSIAELPHNAALDNNPLFSK